METVVWVGIFVCLAHSAMFSGLNLAFFSLSRLRLEAEAAAGSEPAKRILVLRRNANLLLTTILWGNVAINVLLTLLSGSVMAGASAFLFSTVVITFAGEILPQAYFSRRAMKMASMLSPVVRFYQRLFYPVAKPSAWVLDRLVGEEHVEYLREGLLKGVIEQHIDAAHAEIDFVEGRGALNFLEIDDVPISEEGESVDPGSIVSLPCRIDLPLIPEVESPDDPFVAAVNASGRKWVILADPMGEPHLILDADAYLRAVLANVATVDPYAHCHRPIIITNPNSPLGTVIAALKRGDDAESDAAIESDIVLLWTGEARKIITGADLLGRLLRGI